MRSSPIVDGLVEALLKSRIPKESDLELVKTYFSEREEINLEIFRRENCGYYLEISSIDETQGYLFFPELQLDRNHETRMETELGRQKKLGRVITRKFTDYHEGISGFHWRIN